MANINATLLPDDPKASLQADKLSGHVESQAAVGAVVVGGSRLGLTFRITEETEQRLTEDGQLRILG